MPDFNEALLQFIWQHRLLKPVPFYTSSGNEVMVLKPGSLNPHAGPDFFNAQIRLNGLLLAGNIEVHLRTSDWLRHGHEHNRDYDHLILHVVYEHDVDLVQNLAHRVEVLELKGLVDAKTLEEYRLLAGSKEKLPCSGQLKQVDDLHFTAWMERMAIERLEEKTARIQQLYDACTGDYIQVFYTLLLRNFGFHVNALPFELLARQLPVQILLKHADSLLQLEALLLGSSGLLEDQFKDKYIQALQNEFAYLKQKYTLTPLNKELFKFSKLRPANFPNVRLAQLATIIHTQARLLTAPQEFNSYAALRAALEIKPVGYWQHHYTLDGDRVVKDLALGAASIESILVNTFAPFFFFYSKKLGKPAFSDLAIQLLQRSAFEINTKTKLFAAKKQALVNAADSQGIINLYDNYCSKKQCLKCGIAASLLYPASLAR